MCSYTLDFTLIGGLKQARSHEGAFRGRAPQMTACVPPNDSCASPSDDCAPKKLIGSGLPGCKSRPETHKIVLIASELVKNRKIFEIKTTICAKF